MKIISFNVNGIRAIIKRSFEEDIRSLDPDVLCLQETKAQDDQVKEALSSLEDTYEIYSNSAVKKGYSGTAILTKKTPISIRQDIGIEEHDQEGRVLAVEFEEYFVVNVYVPNSGSELKRLDYRQTWDKALLTYLKKLEAEKPVILCGDLNVAHKEIDLARPKQNYNKAAGFMQEEIDGIDAFTSNGFIDTFRNLHPSEEKYSWWSYRGGARERNVGWRIDYFLASEVLRPKIKNANILNDVFGSDHCPVSLEVK
jgi:exodeoxyribonuclease-3